jgi:signal transduction histidine kinase
MEVVRWLTRPFRPRTVRARMTILYGGLFLLSGAALLAIASGVVVRSSARVSVGHAGAPGANLGNFEQIQRQLNKLPAQLAHTTQAKPLTHALFMASLVALAIMAAVSVLIGWMFAGRSLRPLRRITATARRISEDNLHERLAFDGPRDELKDLADTFDGLLERLEAAFAAQRRFVANASHELRTPLATMRASLDVAIAKPGPLPPQTEVLADRLRAELDRVDELLESFLVLARAQHGALPSHDVISLDGLVADAVSARAADISAAGLHLRLRTDAEAGASGLVEGSKPLLRRMADNVIDNAIVHNQPRGWIDVAVWAVPAGSRIVVENGGPVLEQPQVAQLTQPFRRLGADRVGSDRGSGLGLSIVAAIAAAHRGSVELSARPDGGLRVTIELPPAGSTPGSPAAGRPVAGGPAGGGPVGGGPVAGGPAAGSPGGGSV